MLSPTRATPSGPLILVLPTNIYQGYFYRMETNTFRGRYADILALYYIDLAAAVANAAIADITQLIYDMDQEGVRTAFLQFHQGARGRGYLIALLHSVSK